MSSPREVARRIVENVEFTGCSNEEGLVMAQVLLDGQKREVRAAVLLYAMLLGGSPSPEWRAEAESLLADINVNVEGTTPWSPAVLDGTTQGQG